MHFFNITLLSLYPLNFLTAPDFQFTTASHFTQKNIKVFLQTHEINEKQKQKTYQNFSIEPGKPTATEQSKPTSTEQNKPTFTKQSKPTSTEQNKPTATEQSKPTSTEQNKPTSTEQNKPTATEQSKPTATEQNKPTATEQSKPTATEQSKQTATEQSKPTSTEQSKPAAIEQGKQNATESGTPTDNRHSNYQSTDDRKNQKIINKELNFYITDLITIGQNLNYNNYEKTVYQKICPYMKTLQTWDATKQINKTKRKRFLEEVVKVYGTVLDFSDEHYIMYCVYDYYKSAEPGEILSISKKILSQKKQTRFKRMLKLCDKEQNRGNGDDPKKFSAKVSWKEIRLLPSNGYKKMSPFARLHYIKEVKSSYLQFELDITEDNPLTQTKTAILFPVFDFFIAYTSANFQGKCLIGGVTRNTIYSKRLRRNVCPIYGRNCDGQTNTFQCGVVFNNRCIPINPARSLSKRCYEASENTPINSADYDQYKSYIENITREYCIGQRSNWAGCINFMKRMRQINQATSKSPPEDTSSSRPQTSTGDTQTTTPTGPVEKANAITEATAVCTECPKTDTGVAAEVQQLKEITKQPTQTYTDMVEYFSDTVFDNASCKCEGNDACKRGCKPGSEISNNESPPVGKCTGEKPMEKSISRCMRYVTNAIMNTTHKFLKKYCDDKNIGTLHNRKDYGQCVRKFTYPSSENSICKNGFVFPSALCALNLDGKSSNSFNKIKDNFVKRRCQKWNLFNQSLTSIPIKKDDGSVENIPLFKKMPVSSDTSKIPGGAIIVTQSPGRHGHIEIKTNKNTCGRDKNQPCFCSDYCRARPEYNNPFKVEAIFQWNPKALEYIQQSI